MSSCLSEVAKPLVRMPVADSRSRLDPERVTSSEDFEPETGLTIMCPELCGTPANHQRRLLLTLAAPQGCQRNAKVPAKFLIVPAPPKSDATLILLISLKVPELLDSSKQDSVG